MGPWAWPDGDWRMSETRSSQTDGLCWWQTPRLGKEWVPLLGVILSSLMPAQSAQV